jgi:two-component system LytT family response regulator
MTIRATIIDNEELARLRIRVLAEQAGDVEIIEECSNGCDAIKAIRTRAPDLVFLDVQMPDKNAFEVIEEIGVQQRPYIVFVTAFDGYALRAFDVRAIDYLLKPIDEQRFAEALSRVRTALSREHDSDVGRRLDGLIAELGSSGRDTHDPRIVNRIAIKQRDRIVLVRIADVDWVEADGDYVTLHVGDKKWLMRETITRIETRLAPASFVRIHRSILVNADRVQELRPLPKGDFAIVLADGTELKLSRNYRDAVRRVAGTDL